jgi:hypothetical protein
MSTRMISSIPKSGTGTTFMASAIPMARRSSLGSRLSVDSAFVSFMADSVGRETRSPEMIASAPMAMRSHAHQGTASMLRRSWPPFRSKSKRTSLVPEHAPEASLTSASHDVLYRRVAGHYPLLVKPSRAAHPGRQDQSVRGVSKRLGESLVRRLAAVDLPTALDAVRAVGRPDFRLLIDTMHLVRSGSGPAELAALDPDLIGYVQLSDVPLVATIPDYMEEACFERMVPGTGELPLLEILAAPPRHVVIGIEVPLRSQADAGVGPHERLGRCVDAARGLLAQLDDE